MRRRSVLVSGAAAALVRPWAAHAAEVELTFRYNDFGHFADPRRT